MAEFDGVLFSDLHLSELTEPLNALFDAFVERVAGTPEIACLGDLTEYWIGYMHLRLPFGKYLFDHMQRLAKGAKRAVFVPGNRDFLFNGQARKAGYEVHANVYEGEFCGRRVAFEHGDRFCTKDIDYQKFRRWFRKLPWDFLQLVISEKRGHKLAQNLRKKSKASVARKSVSAFGIQPEKVQRLVTRGAEVVVCGHVHSPFSRNYAGAKNVGRLMVMSDWRPDGAIVGTVKNGEFRLMKFDGNGFQPFEAPSEQNVYAHGMIPSKLSQLAQAAAESETRGQDPQAASNS